MMHRRMTPGLVLGVVAVVLASAGTATAVKLITSSQIKNHTIKLVDISQSAQTALRGQKGSLGPVGPPGPAGPPGSAALSQIQLVEGPEVALGPDGSGSDINTSDAVCPAGSHVVSGGYTTITGNAETFSNRAYDRSSWSALADNDSSVSGYVKALAYCTESGKAVTSKRQRLRPSTARLINRVLAKYRAAERTEHSLSQNR
jgi:hypothetical protein